MLGEDIVLFVPEQIYNEVYRNRENKIKDALDKFEKFDLQFPVFIKNYDDYDAFYKRYSDLKKNHKAWLKKVKLDIANQSTPADLVLREFFEAIEIIPSTPEIIQRGVLRYNIGNPPGKDKKYGDAINWETLIDCVPNGEDLFFISSDKDYASIYDENQFHPFLAREWKEKKQSHIVFFKSLVDFLKEHVKEIELLSESEKDSLIDELAHSGSFQTTHRLVKELSSHTDWSLRQMQDICSAAENNKQIYWILGDDDLYQFFGDLLSTEQMKRSTDSAVAFVREELERIKAEMSSDGDDDDWQPSSAY